MLETGATIAGGLLLFVAGWFINQYYQKQNSQKANMKAGEILSSAKEEAEQTKNDILLKAREEQFRLRESLEKEYQERESSLEQLDQKIQGKENFFNERSESLDIKEHDLMKKEEGIAKMKESIQNKDKELSQIIKRENERLDSISGLSVEEAKKLLFSNIETDTKLEAAKLSKRILNEAKENAVREAKEIVTRAVEKVASEHTTETTVSVVHLSSDEIKGRIIGRDGRNIKAFENLTGVKIIVDDTPEAVVLSGFDPVKREIARIALEKLIKGGKINPQRVEEAIRKCEKEIEQLIWKSATQCLKDLEIRDVHPEMIKTLGRLKFRTSYGQNVLNHCKEVALLCGAMAAELGLDIKLAKRAALFHDIGKAISQNSESTHTQLGVELAKKYNEHKVVINAIASHHEDEIKDNPISILVSAADSISGSRPGARRETLENYVRRIDSLEKLADSFPGVSKSFAISAGREIRVIVEPERVTDDEAYVMSSEIAKKIQSEMEYPGHIKVTVIRETKSVQSI